MSDALGFLIETNTAPEPLPCLGASGCDRQCSDRCYYRDYDAMEPWRKVLLDAADLIEREGWVRGADGYGFGKTAGPVCIVGAIYRNGRYMIEALNAVNRWCAPGASFWNDHVARDAAEVTAALRACAVQP